MYDDAYWTVARVMDGLKEHNLTALQTLHRVVTNIQRDGKSVHAANECLDVVAFYGKRLAGKDFCEEDKYSEIKASLYRMNFNGLLYLCLTNWEYARLLRLKLMIE